MEGAKFSSQETVISEGHIISAQNLGSTSKLNGPHPSGTKNVSSNNKFLNEGPIALKVEPEGKNTEVVWPGANSANSMSPSGSHSNIRISQQPSLATSISLSQKFGENDVVKGPHPSGKVNDSSNVFLSNPGAVALNLLPEIIETVAVCPGFRFLRKTSPAPQSNNSI